MAEVKHNWRECDPATLSPELAKAYAEYKAIYAKAKAARQAFEQAAVKAAELDNGLTLLFSYNFGKLNIAVAKAEPKKTASAKAVSFKDIAA
jgi:flagellar basal body rod protein FlgF